MCKDELLEEEHGEEHGNLVISLPIEFLERTTESSG